MRQCLVEQQRIVARIVHDLGAERAQRPVKRHLGRGDQVAPPHGHAVEAEPVGDRVNQPLAHKAPLEPSRRAIGRRRRLVGQAEMTDRAIGRDPIGAGQHADRHLGDARAMRADIGALVEEELVLQGQDTPLGIDRDAGVMVLLARVVGRHQMLAPILDPFDRAAQPQRGEAHQKILGVKLAADAETAAGIALLQHDRGGGAAEHAGQCVAVAMRHLGRAIELEHVARGVEAGEGAARLQRRAAVPADRQVERDDGMGRGEGRVDLAIAGPHDQRLG